MQRMLCSLIYRPCIWPSVTLQWSFGRTKDASGDLYISLSLGRRRMLWLTVCQWINRHCQVYQWFLHKQVSIWKHRSTCQIEGTLFFEICRGMRDDGFGIGQSLSRLIYSGWKQMPRWDAGKPCMPLISKTKNVANGDIQKPLMSLLEKRPLQQIVAF